jgi:hypothetical protein
LTTLSDQIKYRVGLDGTFSLNHIMSTFTFDVFLPSDLTTPVTRGSGTSSGSPIAALERAVVETMFAVCAQQGQQGHEGVVAKRLDSVYLPGQRGPNLAQAEERGLEAGPRPASTAAVAGVIDPLPDHLRSYRL